MGKIMDKTLSRIFPRHSKGPSRIIPEILKEKMQSPPVKRILRLFARILGAYICIKFTCSEDALIVQNERMCFWFILQFVFLDFTKF